MSTSVPTAPGPSGRLGLGIGLEGPASVAFLCPCCQVGQGTLSLVVTLLSGIHMCPGGSFSQREERELAGPRRGAGGDGRRWQEGAPGRWVEGVGPGQCPPARGAPRFCTRLCLPLAAPRQGRRGWMCKMPLGVWGARGRLRAQPHLQVKTSVRSLQVLHLTKQHQWNLQLHCHTLVYWWVL